MKIFFYLLTLFLCIENINAQRDYKTLPNNYNSFVTGPSVSWACQFSKKYSFPNTKLGDKSIYWYFIDGQANGKVKSYIGKDWVNNSEELKKLYKSKIKEGFFIEVEKKHRELLFQNLNFDSREKISFEEILFIEDHKLSAYLISASPTINIITASGIDLGNTGLTHSCINKNHNFTSSKNDSILFLRNTYDIFNLDSLEEFSNIKKTYNMNLALTMWYDLSNGYNKAIDLKRKKSLSGTTIMDYSVFDSVEVLICGDSFPCPPSIKIPGEPARLHFSHLGLSQDWYYNKTRDIFFSKITEVFLYTKIYLNQNKEEINKSIKILF